MSSNCKVLYGIDNACGDLLQASGVDKDFYVGYVSDLAIRFNLTLSAAISNISFLPYMGLIKFGGQKFSHVFSHELAKGGGGSISYTHKGTVKLMALSTQDDLELMRLTQAQDAFIVWQDNNESFFIHAPSKGLMAVPGALKTSGQNAGEDTTTSVSLEGNEKVVPLRFSAGTTAATVLYLDGLVR